MNEMLINKDNVLEVIEGAARDVALLYGAAWGDDAASAFLGRITDLLGGAQVYVPRVSASKRERRDRTIRQKFNGRNIRSLSREFGISERTIRRVLRADKRNMSQPISETK